MEKLNKLAKAMDKQKVPYVCNIQKKGKKEEEKKKRCIELYLNKNDFK